VVYCERSYYWAVRGTQRHLRTRNLCGRSLCSGPSKPLPAACGTLARVSQIILLICKLRSVSEIGHNQIDQICMHRPCPKCLNWIHECVNPWSSMSNGAIKAQISTPSRGSAWCSESYQEFVWFCVITRRIESPGT
jgi:hypothetical protein